MSNIPDNIKNIIEQHTSESLKKLFYMSLMQEKILIKVLIIILTDFTLNLEVK